MKNYRRLISITLILFLLLVESVFANNEFRIPEFNGISPQNHINKIYTNERKNELKSNTIIYNNIEDMIHLYNPEVLSMWNQWENNKSSNDIYSDYNDAADSLEGGGGSSEVEDAMLRAQATGMRIQADMNYSDSYTNFLSNYAKEKNLVLSSKVLYFNCLKSENSFKNADEAVKEAERKVNSAEVGYANGASTYVDLLTAKKALADAKSSQVLAISNYNSSKRNLFVNCGKPMNSETNIIKEDINHLFDVTKISFDADYQLALKLNFQYEIYKRGKENAVTDEVRKQMDINLGVAETKIYNDLQSKYNNLLDSVTSYNNYEMAMKLANDTYTQAKNSYAHGSISKNEYLSAEYAYNLAKNDFDGAIYDVNIAYITYKAAVDGLASC